MSSLRVDFKGMGPRELIIEMVKYNMSYFINGVFFWFGNEAINLLNQYIKKKQNEFFGFKCRYSRSLVY